ncbi:MAG: cupin domain-containing protein [Actinomycetota bacterium]
MNPALTQDQVLTADELQRRVIEPDEFVADTSAFIDVRIPGSAGKASYSMIGPGVSQNADQAINVAEPHGFNIGAASMPPGVVNNQHLHYTAEVFICTTGRWEMRLGQQGEQRLEVGPGSVFSVPTWVFRGFRNIGEGDGWLFAVLGGDDTGGILWAPEVLEAAAETGLFLSADYDVVDTTAGQTVDDPVRPVSEGLLDALDHYSDDEIAQRVVTRDELAWSDQALLGAIGCAAEVALAPVIGFGLSEDRHHRPPIWNPHGFSLEWLRLGPGASTGLHAVDRPMAYLTLEGDAEVVCNRDPADRVRAQPTEGSVLSMPAGVWRELSNPGDQPAIVAVVRQGDQRCPIRWDEAVAAAADHAGWSIDAGGYLAPIGLLARRV